MELLMKRLSIKWKLSLALIATGMVLVISYVLLAKRVFENDKISYVFDSQSSQLASQKREIQQRFSKALLTSRTIIATYDLASGVLSPTGEQIFHEEPSLVALELWNESSQQAVFQVEKQSGLLPPATQEEASVKSDELQIIPQADDHYLLLLRYTQAGEAIPLRLRAVAEFKNLLPEGETHQTFLLAQKDRLITQADEFPILQKMVQQVSTDPSERTLLWENGSSRYLVSTAPVGVGDLRLFAVTPEEVALGALGTLFRRSLIFMGFSICGLVIVSLALARGLTSNLEKLTQIAKRIGQGEFEVVSPVKSKDEMGVLSHALSTMAHEIQRLLIETKDKTRMEDELKTARLVQERLLPQEASCDFNELQINGQVLSSTECSGDWWYYFKKNDDLYIAIADATGHGTPAALITAAARSIFSRLERDDMTLPQMMRAWDQAVMSCSHGRVFMTGILMRVNSRSGEGAFISASHEAPYVLHEKEDGFDATYLDLDLNKSLGDGLAETLKEQSFKMEPNSSLVLYTDGLFSVEHADGKKLSERRFGKSLAAHAEFARTAEETTKMVLRIFEEHRRQAPLPDDVTIVCLRRKGPRKQTILTSDDGTLERNRVLS